MRGKFIPGEEPQRAPTCVRKALVCVRGSLQSKEETARATGDRTQDAGNAVRYVRSM